MSRAHKYRAKPTTVDGIRFASQKEARRYRELRLLECAGKISDLELQVKYALVDVIKYVADFRYKENGETVVEDVKGYKTPIYRRKAKLMKKQHGIEIKET